MFDTSLAREADKERHDLWEARRRRTLASVLEVSAPFFGDLPIDVAYVTGSLVREGAFRPWSDIDIAVAGLPGDIYFRTLAGLQDILGSENVDLIELERCDFRETVEGNGVRIV